MTSRASYQPDWESARDPHASPAATAVDATHAATLEVLLSTLHTAVALEMRCDLDDVSTGQPQNSECFRGHFPALDRALERWNAAVDRAQAAPDALWRRFTSSARDRGITEPPFVVGVLIDQVATSTIESSRRWELDSAPEVALEHFNDRVDGGTHVSVYVMGRRVATLPGGPEPEVQRRVEAADARIRALFEEARNCEEARHIADAQDELLALKQRLLDELEEQRSNALIMLAPDCPRCRWERSAERSAPES
jgi:hypothetical protein